LVAIVVLAGVVVGLALPLLQVARGAAAKRGSVRLVAPGGKQLRGHWQAWANASLVPTARGRVTLRLSGCPGWPRAAGCVYTRQPRVVYLREGLRNPRGVMLHELGHVFDLTVLSNRDRGQFRRIMGRPASRWWIGEHRLSEWFAEAYSWCARYTRIVSLERYALYRYRPSAFQHRRVCALIKRAARDRRPPTPPKAPPTVTDDPVPPTPPPLDPAVVPGDVQYDPGPAAPESATPTDAPAPVASLPLPTVVPIPTYVIPTPEPDR
jgi:hypothetical protein